MKRHSWRANLARIIIKGKDKHPNWIQRWGIVLILLTYKKGTPVRSMYLPGLSGGRIKE